MTTALPNCWYNIGGWTTKDNETNYVEIPGTLAVCSLNGGAPGSAINPPYPGEKNWWTGDAWVYLGGDGQVDTRLSNVANQAAFTDIATAYAAVYPISDFSNRAMRIARPNFTHSVPFTVPVSGTLRIYIPQGATFNLNAYITLSDGASLEIEGESSSSILSYTATGGIGFGTGASATLKNLTLQKNGIHSQFLFSDATDAYATIQTVTLLPGANSNLLGNLSSAQHLRIIDCICVSDAASQYVIATPTGVINDVVIQNFQVSGTMNGTWMQVDLSTAGSSGGIYGFTSSATSGLALTLIARVPVIQTLILETNDTTSANPTVDVSSVSFQYITNLYTGNILLGGPAQQRELFYTGVVTNHITVGITVDHLYLNNFLLYTGVDLINSAPALTVCSLSNGEMPGASAFENVQFSSFSNINALAVSIPDTCTGCVFNNLRCSGLTVAGTYCVFQNVYSSGALTVSSVALSNKFVGCEFSGVCNVLGTQSALISCSMSTFTLNIGTNGNASQAQGSVVSGCFFQGLTLNASNCVVQGCYSTAGSPVIIRGANNTVYGNQVASTLDISPSVHPSVNSITGNVVSGAVTGTGNNTSDILSVTSNTFLSTVTLANFINSSFAANYGAGAVTFTGGASNTGSSNSLPGFAINMGVGVNSAAFGNRTSAATADTTANNLA